MSLVAHLRSRLPDYLNALQSMVAVNSFTTNAAGVDAVGEVAAGLFAALGFTAEWVPARSPEFGRHLFLRRPGASARHVAFISHLDTVFPPQEETAEDFRWRRDGDRVIGPGAADIKGGTMVAFMVLDALRAVHPHVFDAFSWMVALDACEEHLEPDFARNCRERLPAEATAAILVMECGQDGKAGCPLVVCRKGMVNFEVTVTGKASHSGTGFWRGRNAILDAARLALEMAEVSDRDRHLTVNIGVVQGGTVTNRVPHECVLSGEMRAFDPEVLAHGMSRLRGIVEKSGIARIEFSCELSPWPENPGSRSLLEVWRKAGAGLGMAVEPEWRGGLSDGNLLWMHAPTLDGLGPIGGNCHCSQKGPDGQGQEYALEASFVSKALLSAAALVGMAGEELV